MLDIVFILVAIIFWNTGSIHMFNLSGGAWILGISYWDIKDRNLIN